ncbi:MAG: FAD-binding protein [Myxococcales bacterium]|nr:FAD-binding protein [Myxococcales bacterium]
MSSQTPSASPARPAREPSPAPESRPITVSDPDAARWDDVTDVLVVGLGGAGACAALQAKQDGVQVLGLDRFHGGGATAISGGVFYAGGGTHIQREASVEDDVEEMFRYLSLEVKDSVSRALLRDFCEQSVANLSWLERHGVPFEASLCPVKTSYPTDDYYLYYSGNESFRPYRDAAKPAARGHRAKGEGLPGKSFYEPLRQSLLRMGVETRYEARVTRLIVDDAGRVIGAEYSQVKPGLWAAAHRALHEAAIQIVKYNPKLAKTLNERTFEIEAQHAVVRRARAKKGVVLAAGGFIYNRAMVREHAPSYRKGMPLGTVGDDGSGIRLGQSVGGKTDRLGRVSAWRFINPPEAFARGLLVNGKGERYINEFMYGAAIGEAMVEHNDGVALLILDQTLRDQAREQSRPGQAQWFQRAPALLNLWFNAKRANTIAGLAKALGVPPTALEATVAEYNAAARGERQDRFGKDRDRMHALDKGPFYGIDCSMGSKRFPCPTLTLGGLVVEETSGRVTRDDGKPIEGLYAVGRTAVGICSQQYVSGLSIADCVYSGRRAGRHAAAQDRAERVATGPIAANQKATAAATTGAPAAAARGESARTPVPVSGAALGANGAEHRAALNDRPVAIPRAASTAPAARAGTDPAGEPATAVKRADEPAATTQTGATKTGAAKKATATKAPGKRAAAKKSAGAKKTTTKKAAAKGTGAKKTATKKAAAKKAPATKGGTEGPAPRKAATKKRAATKKAPAKRNTGAKAANDAGAGSDTAAKKASRPKG